MEDNNKGIRLREIDLAKLYKKLSKQKKLFAITLSLAFVISAFIIMCVPRFYICTVKLAPETSTPNMGNLGSLASNLGINIGNMASQDAIIPEFYPDVMESVDFQTNMFNTKVTSKDGKVSTTYYQYLSQYQKVAWWSKLFGAITKLFKSKENNKKNSDNVINPFRLTKLQSDIAHMVGSKVKSDVDKKTDVITITVEDQDPLICATIADSATNKLQHFIIKYRTSKALNDLRQAKNLCSQAKEKYVRAQRIYASYADANEEVILQSFKSKEEELENEMQLQYNNYQMMTQQVQLAIAKVQERTPAFTTLQSATVPIKPAGPKRMMFVALCLFLTFIATSIYVYRKDEQR
jgi:capsular polysaccharide biosynthesis protein